MEATTMFILFFWLILCCVVGSVAKDKGRSFSSYFFLSLLTSPIIGFIVLAIKGTPTEDELIRNIRNTRHIYHCPNCNSSYSKIGENTELCPECNSSLIETSILTDEWRSFSDEIKNEYKTKFVNGEYNIKNIISSSNQNNTTTDVDELKKYKELFDSGVITKEEFNAKKKQILKL